MSVIVESRGPIRIFCLSRPERRNAIDRDTARSLADALRGFEADETSKIAILTGDGGNFCAGADLKAIAEGTPNRLEPEGDAPLGPSRMLLQKPLIAAIAGYAVAGGLELALLADLRVAEKSATLGVFCRRFGVPLIDGGTVRLPRVIGLGRALDLILTGRAVGAEEALAMGLVNRVVPDGHALDEAIRLAENILSFPEICMRSDRLSTYEGLDLPLEEALRNEFRRGRGALEHETRAGAIRFVEKDY